jgi:hypothetical protein
VVNNAVYWDETLFDWKELIQVSVNVLPSSDRSSYPKRAYRLEERGLSTYPANG